MVVKLRGRFATQIELAEIVGKSVVTVRSWEKEGMPVYSKGERGKASTYNTADCVDWLRSRGATKSDLPDDEDEELDDGRISEDEGRRRRVVAEAMRAELALANESGKLVDIEAVALVVEAVFSRVRVRLLAMPGSLALTLTNEPDPDAIRARVLDEVSEALNELSSADSSWAAGVDPAGGYSEAEEPQGAT
jgi:phage terminase Nu1 subunit (DNA packaging protein)